jgi:hypothetical protein
MDIIIRDALTGLLLLHAGDNSSNDSKDGSTNPTNNDSDATPTSNRDDSTPISNDGMDATLPTFNRSDSTPISNDGMDATPTSSPDGRTAGHRHTATNDGKKQRGGKRVRMEYNHALATSDIHLDLLTALDEFDEDNTSLRYSLRLLEDGQDESEDEAM